MTLPLDYTIFRVIDFETTGMPPDAAVCEVGWCDVRMYADGHPPEVGDPQFRLCNPGRPMPPEARAVHHISDADLADAPAASAAFLDLSRGEPDFYVAHNVEFERSFFTGGATRWICTLKVGRHLYPDCPSHTNQCLRYFLGLDLPDQLAMPPHRAAPDAYVTAHLLRVMLQISRVDDMLEWTEQPSLLPRVTFGKHRGSTWQDVPSDYLRWLIEKSDMGDDVRFTARHHLEARKAKAS